MLNLDIGLPLEQLWPALKNCLNGETELQQLVLGAINRRGRQIRCEVTCTPLRGADDEIRGAIILIDEVSGPKLLG